MLKTLIKKLMQQQDLSDNETAKALEEILSGASPEQTAAFLVLLHAKGETADELLGLADAMRKAMKTVELDFPVLDIVGTGGDNANTVNISTASSLLAAACGAKVVKHGNRSVSSRCGSADILEALGVRFNQSPADVKKELLYHNFSFCFSPNFHPAMKTLSAIRKALGVRTSFNLMGPLLNPAKAQYMLLGVYRPDCLELFAEVLIRLGVKRAMIVHSCGLDEFSLLGPSQVIEIQDQKKEAKTIDAKNFGFAYCELKAIQGGGIEKNKLLIQQALTGTPGPIADTIVFNTGIALYIADLVSSIKEGIVLAKNKIKTGDALNVINK